MFIFPIPTNLKPVILILLIHISATAQHFNLTPPGNVQATFTQKFPEAGKVKWEHHPEEKKEFLASFILTGIKMKAYFDKNGTWIETEKEIHIKELPERVLLSIRTQYPSEKIISAYEIQKDKKMLLYEVVLKTEHAKTNLVISNDGYFTSR